MAKDFSKTANDIVKNVGGKDNVKSVTHCVTRLRLVLKDQSKADDDAVRDVLNVKGLAKQGGQYQIIIGTDVGTAYDELLKVVGPVKEEAPIDENLDEEKDSLFNRFFKTISGCIFPILGLMIASGMIKGILTLLVTLGITASDGGIYQILYAGADGLMYFMPIIIGFSAGKYFGGNPYLTAALGAALVYPDIITLYNNGTSLSFAGIPVVLASYANSVFPIILASWAESKVEKFWKKVIPDVISMMFVPFMTLIVMVPVTFLVIGPIMTAVSNLLASGTEALWSLSPVIAGVILGAFWQVIVIFGLHYAFVPILVNNIATNGVDPINAVLGISVMALVGAGVGYAFKQKNQELKAESRTCSLTAFLGVTEPIIYSIALPKKRPFVAAFVGGGIGGGILAASGAAMQGFGNGGIFQTLMMISPTDSMNVVWFLISSAVAIVISGIVSYMICITEPLSDAKASANETENKGKQIIELDA